MGKKPRSCTVVLWLLLKDQRPGTKTEPRLRTIGKRLEKSQAQCLHKLRDAGEVPMRDLTSDLNRPSASISSGRLLECPQGRVLSGLGFSRLNVDGARELGENNPIPGQSPLSHAL